MAPRALGATLHKVGRVALRMSAAACRSARGGSCSREPAGRGFGLARARPGDDERPLALGKLLLQASQHAILQPAHWPGRDAKNARGLTVAWPLHLARAASRSASASSLAASDRRKRASRSEQRC